MQPCFSSINYWKKLLPFLTYHWFPWTNKERRGKFWNIQTTNICKHMLILSKITCKIWTSAVWNELWSLKKEFLHKNGFFPLSEYQWLGLLNLTSLFLVFRLSGQNLNQFRSAPLHAPVVAWEDQRMSVLCPKLSPPPSEAEQHPQATTKPVLIRG